MNWKIEWMKCVADGGAIANYVVECGWRCAGDDQGQAASVYGSCAFAMPDDPSGALTPYDSLTEEQVLGWVWSSGVDKDATEAAVRTQLDSLINPPVITPALPWSNA